MARETVAEAIRNRNPAVHQAGREYERAIIAASLRRRGSSALAMATKGLLVRSEAVRLKRWLDVAAEDVEQGID